MFITVHIILELYGMLKALRFNSFFSSSEIHLQSWLVFNKTFIIDELDKWKWNFQLFISFPTFLPQVSKIYTIFSHAVKRTTCFYSQEPSWGMEFYPYETTQYSFRGQTPLYHCVTILEYYRMNAPVKVYGFPQLRALKISSSS